MRNILDTIARAAETETGSAPATTTATPKAADSGKRKIRTAKPRKPAKPAKADADKPKTGHGILHGTSAYRGASPVFRGHGRKLSPIVLDRIPGSYTDRDAAFCNALYSAHGTKPFQRGDADAGNVSRAIGHGYIKPVSGQLDTATATFAITAKFVSERKQSATAKPKA